MLNSVYIALGSNLGSPKEQVKQAINAIQQLPNTELLQCSSFYRTTPLGPANQPDYLNAVLSIETTLPADSLLKSLQTIETQLGRVRSGLRWEARTLDLDILLFGNQIIQTTTLTVPHYAMHQRSFVLIPLYEIAPQLILPCGHALIHFIEQLPQPATLPVWE